MKNLLLIIALTLSFSICAQRHITFGKTFIRVYDIRGKKVGKGKIIAISETILSLKRGGNYIELPVSNIGLIKTKHAAGNNLLVGAAIGIPAGVIVGHESYKPGGFLSPGAGASAAGGGITGSIAGAVIGGITLFFKNSHTYVISGSTLKWKVFKEKILFIHD
jgi:hypothetical protein